MTVLFATTAVVSRSDAITISVPAALDAAAQQDSLAQSIAYVCHRVWQCGDLGYDWKRVCSSTGRRYYHRPYHYVRRYYRRYYQPRYYGYSPYSGRWTNDINEMAGCPIGWTVQDGVCKPYRGY